jgi:peptidoglycan/xylan/chitin deacetylase (PgdA/CDA1 family)
MRFVGPLADLEEELGFRSSFNFVPEGYQVDGSLLEQLRRRGFEIGVHGLRHDGKDFWSKRVFEQRAIRINGYLREWDAVGFRAPFTHRNPEWMQLLEIEYDSSFFDTDPYESMPGGTMSIWPFFCGRFVELPYTLMQDHTLFEVFGETARPWLEKVDFIARWGGMALVNAHPDYLRVPARLAVYREFLGTVANQMKQAQNSGRHYCWHSLPREVARWWRRRCQGLERGVDERPATTPAGTSGKNGP